MLRRVFFTIGLLMISISVFSQSKLNSRQITKRNYQEVIGDYINSTDTIVPDKYAMYPDGMQGVINHVSKNLNYPRNALSKRIQGSVILKFVVEKDGSIKEIEILQSADQELNTEAIRVLKKLKTWVPGYKDEKPVRVSYTFPFNFRL